MLVVDVYLPHEEQEQTTVQLQTFVIPQLQSELEAFLSEKPKTAVPIPIAKAVIIKYFFISLEFSFINYIVITNDELCIMI